MAETILYSSPFVPPEWIAAHGLRPRRWLGGERKEITTPPGACAFACGLARGSAPAGAEVDTAGIVFTTTCDQMRRSAEFRAEQSPPRFLMNIPATWRTAAARELYREELHRFSRFLIACGGSAPPPGQLVRTMNQYSVQRAGFALAHLSRDDSPRCAMAHPAGTRARVAIVGGPLRQQDHRIVELLEQAGGQIVLDASETGERCRPAAFDAQRLVNDPVEELVRAYFDTIPDVFRRPDTMLYDYLRNRLADRQVQGIVLVRHVWCDQWHAHVVRLRQTFGLPVVEIDLGAGNEHWSRTRTRLETLATILQ